MASCVALAACGATERIGQAKQTGRVVVYAAKLAPVMAKYGAAISAVQADPAVLENAMSRAAAPAYARAAADVSKAERDLVKLNPPGELAKDQTELAGAMRQASGALTFMARAANGQRPRQFQRASTSFGQAQERVGRAIEAMVADSGVDIPKPPEVTPVS